LPYSLWPRVAHTLPSMYAPHEHGQHRCHRVLSVACSGFLTVADIKGNVGATRDSGNYFTASNRRDVCATRRLQELRASFVKLRSQSSIKNAKGWAMFLTHGVCTSKASSPRPNPHKYR